MATGRLTREWIVLQRTHIPHIMARPSNESMLVWHFALYDFPEDSPYVGGVFHGRLVFPKEYPMKPPSVRVLTPSGRFEPDRGLCLSFSDYHPETWNPAWRIETILIGLLSLMTDSSDPSFIGGIHSTRQEKRRLAIHSFLFNLKCKEFCQLFPEFVDSSRYDACVGFFLRVSPTQFNSLRSDASGTTENDFSQPKQSKICFCVNKSTILLLAISIFLIIISVYTSYRKSPY